MIIGFGIKPLEQKICLQRLFCFVNWYAFTLLLEVSGTICFVIKLLDKSRFLEKSMTGIKGQELSRTFKFDFNNFYKNVQ